MHYIDVLLLLIPIFILAQAHSIRTLHVVLAPSHRELSGHWREDITTGLQGGWTSYKCTQYTHNIAMSVALPHPLWNPAATMCTSYLAEKARFLISRQQLVNVLLGKYNELW